MANVKVSSEFQNFLTRNAKAVAEAKTAENTMMTCKMPVGWKGYAVCVGAEAGRGKDYKDDKGNTTPGRDYARLDFNVINDEEYTGAKFSVNWSFWDTEKATAMNRFEWFLNDLENLGGDEFTAVRRSAESTMEDFLNFFVEADKIYSAEVVHNAYRRGDQKEVKVHAFAAVGEGTAMVPDTPPALQIGSEVSYMKKMWILEEADGDDLVIKSKTTGNTRKIKLSELD